MTNSISTTDFDTIIKTITTHLLSQKPTKPVFHDQNYESVPFSQGVYHPLNSTKIAKRISNSNDTTIASANSPSHTIAFIDGGNSEIIGNKVITMHLIRTCALLYAHEKRTTSITKEYIGVSSQTRQTQQDPKDTALNNSSKKKHCYSLTLYGKDTTQQLDFETEKETSEDGIHFLRRMQEIELATSILQTLSPGDCIILDGSLQVKSDKEWVAMQQLLHEATKKNVAIIGVIKSSNIGTNSDINAITAVLSKAPPGQSFVYLQLCSKTPATHPVVMGIVKLHPASSFGFVIEIASLDKQYKPTDIQELMNTLVPLSADPSFLGYPYGLIEADLTARCTNQEKMHFQARLLASLHTNAERSLIKSLQASSNAHGLLDHLAGNKTIGELFR